MNSRPRSGSFGSLALLVLAMGAACAACSGGSSGTTGTGGSTGTGGTSATGKGGASPGTGGNNSSGGTTGTGGSVSTGTGGSVSTGGSTGTGGSVATGGSTGTGGSVATGAPTLEYLFKEDTGTTLDDTSAGTPANATITPGASGAWTGSSPHLGYNFNGTGYALSGSLNGTKVQTAFQGTTKATVQVVADVPSNGDNFTLAGIYFPDLDQLISVAIESNEIVVCIDNCAGIYKMPPPQLPSSGTVVLTVVIDTTQTALAAGSTYPDAATNPVRFWLGTTAQNMYVQTAIAQNTPLDHGESWTGTGVNVRMGSCPTVCDQTSGIDRFVAFYGGVAFSSSQAVAGATALASSDDATP